MDLNPFPRVVSFNMHLETNMATENKVDLKESPKKARKRGGQFIKEFGAFINRGSVVDMAVGVIIGGAFSAIVTALVNILLSLCLCAIPGGFANLITPIYTTHAPTGYNDTYSVADFLAQSKTWTPAEIGMYVQHGTTYYYKAIPLLDWG